MIPDGEHPIDIAPLPEPERYPFWTGRDIAVAIGLAVPSLLCGSLIVRAVWFIAGGTPSRRAFVDGPSQVLGYIFLFAALAAWFHMEYSRPLLPSLAGEPSRVPFWAAGVQGAATALSVAIIGGLIRLPQTPTPMQQLMGDRASVIFLLFVGVTIAPLAEELIFRGLIQPVTISRFGVAAGIALPAIGFGLIHIPQYGGSWRHGLLIAGAGACFGYMRHVSGSTVASIVMHGAYNLLLFAGYFIAAGKDVPK